MSIKKLPIDNNFSKRLKKLVKEILELKQIEFCKNIDISSPYLSMVFSGTKKPNAELITKLFFHYREYFDWLLTGVKSETNYSQDDIVKKHDISPSKLINFFEQKDLAREINNDLIEIEKIDPNELIEMRYLIKYHLDKIKRKHKKKILKTIRVDAKSQKNKIKKTPSKEKL